MRIGIFHSGIYWQEFGFRKCGYCYDLLYIYNQKQWDINSYDILIVAKGVHQVFMKSIADSLFSWVSQGGILISFGEVDGNWIEETKWEPSHVGQKIFINEPNHKILENIDELSINKWSKAVHGYFSKIPKDSEILLSVKDSNDKDVTAFIYKKDKGKILSMTLDPDYHTYTEIAFAKDMLINILNWAQSETRDIKSTFQTHLLKKRGFLSSVFVYFKKRLTYRKVILLLLINIISVLLIRSCENNMNLEIKSNNLMIDSHKNDTSDI